MELDNMRIKTKIVLVAINIIYLIISVELFALGSLILSDYADDHSSLLGTYAHAGAVVSLSIAGMTLFLAVSTLIGIYKQHRSTLYACISLLLIAIGLEVGGSITCSVVLVDELTLISSALRSAQSNYWKNSETWDYIQRHFKCCGVDSLKEWYHYLEDSHVPDSCCINYAVGCGWNAVKTNNTYSTSCNAAIYKWSHGYMASLFVICTFLVIIQVTSIFVGHRYLHDLETCYYS